MDNTRTSTLPDEQARKDPRHEVLAKALRWAAPAESYGVERIWGRASNSGNDEGREGNAWAGTPEDVADILIRALWSVDALSPAGLTLRLMHEIERVRELAGRLGGQVQPYCPQEVSAFGAVALDGMSAEEMKAEINRLSSLAGFNLRRAWVAEKKLEGMH